MSKQYTFFIGKSLGITLKNPIRNQCDIIKLLLDTIQNLCTPNSETLTVKRTNEDLRDVFKIVIPNQPNEKIQRIFFYNNYPDYKDKTMYTIQSFCFPFKIEVDEEIKIKYTVSNYDFILDAYYISKIVTIINLINSEEQTWGDDWIQEMIDIIYDESELNINQLFYIINDLLTYDFGYLRFDNDPKHEKVNHPRYHFDIHLDNKSTFKIGLNNDLSINQFISIVDNNSKINYITS